MIRITRNRYLLLAVGIATLAFAVVALRSSDDPRRVTTENTRKGDIAGGTTPTSSDPGTGSPGSSPVDSGPDGPSDGMSPPGGAGAPTNAAPGVTNGTGATHPRPTGGQSGGPGTPAPTPTPTLPATTIPGPVTTTKPPGAGAVGYVGCSLTRSAVAGYHQEGGTRFWPATQEYSGGTVEAWGNNLTSRSKYWQAFDAMNSANPTTMVWWELCAHSNPSDDATYNYALIVLQEIKRRIPGVTVFVSAENGWQAPHVCNAMGVDGPARVRAITNRLVSENRAAAGPYMGDMPLDKIAPDGCHPSMEGGRDLGVKLIAFGF